MQFSTGSLPRKSLLSVCPSRTQSFPLFLSLNLSLSLTHLSLSFPLSFHFSLFLSLSLNCCLSTGVLHARALKTTVSVSQLRPTTRSLSRTYFFSFSCSCSFSSNKNKTVVLKALTMAESKGGASNIAKLVSKQAGRAKEKVISTISEMTNCC